MKLSNYYVAALTVLTLWAGSGCQKENTSPAGGVGTVSFDVSNLAGPAPLDLGVGQYANASGERFTVSKFDYLLSNFQLLRADGSAYVVPDSYFLVSENPGTNTASSGTSFTLANVPVGDYTGLTFMVGVDSARNVAGAQTGALAPTNQMYWDWAQGYIFLKLEGRWQRPDGSTTDLSYHVGGFAGAANALRTVRPAWPDGTALLVRADHYPAVHLTVNLLQLLDGTTATDRVSFAALPSVHMPGPAAVRLASNYSGSRTATAAGTASMFSISHIHAN